MEDPARAWKEVVSSWYPDLATKTYVVPPVHFNRVTYRQTLLPGTNEVALVLRHPDDTPPTTPLADDSSLQRPGSLAFKTDAFSSDPCRGMLMWDSQTKCTGPQQTIQATDLQDDFAQNHVLTNLKALGEDRKEAMFVLSQVSFGQYLNKPAYHAAVEMLGLPLPKDLDTKQVPYSRGEADFVVFHPRRGVLIGEIKSVGRLHDSTPIALPVGKKVAERIKKAIRQLERSEKVVSHLVSDIAPGLTVRKTLFLPYLPQYQLVRTLCLNTVLNEGLCKCLDASDLSEAVDLCVCAEQLSDPDTYWDVTPAVLCRLSSWWRHRLDTDDPLLFGLGGVELYIGIVSRFVGPASTVSIYTSISPRLEVRTAGQAVAELGHRLSHLVLTPQQLDILTRDPRIVCFTGPPGTGKTLMLALQGLRRLREGKDVHIVSTDDDTLAASYLLEYQLHMTLQREAAEGSLRGTNFGAVKMHHFDFRHATEDIVDQAITVLKSHIRQHTLCVIMDEVSFHDSVTAGPRCRSLLARLRKLQDDREVLQLYLGCACIDRGEGSGLEEQRESLTMPLRCAPAIVRQVRRSLRAFQDVSDYSSDGFPAPGEGPTVVKLCHEGENHQGLWPVECPQCGRDVAVELRRLGVGAATSEAPLSPPLRWGDVFVITRSHRLRDDVRDASGHVAAPACGFVRGLRERGVPVNVLCGGGAESVGESEEDRHRRHRRIQDVATGRCAEVTAANGCFLDSLERRVVVWLVYSWSTDRQDMVRLDARDRLFKVSRCTTQLITVVTPSWPTEDEIETFACSQSGQKIK